MHDTFAGSATRGWIAGINGREALLVLEGTRGVRGLDQSDIRPSGCHVVVCAELAVNFEPRTSTFVRRKILRTRSFS